VTNHRHLIPIALRGTNPVGRPPAPAVGQWQPVFLAVLAASGNVTLACQAAGISRTSAYKSREHSKRFSSRWAEAIDTAIDLLEAEARRRAMAGSDLLMIFLLKAHRPEMYRDNYKPTSDVIEGEIIWTVNIDTTQRLLGSG
jgi:hypothetical protein